LVAGLACVRPGTTEPDGDLAFDVVRRAMYKGVLMFAPVGFGSATVKISPPLIIPEAALIESVDALEEAFAEAVGRTAAA
jgi:4-aminobutyrate aminotransferase-like enzyme